VVASWARYAEGTDEQGQPIEVVDRLADRLIRAARRQCEDPLAFITDQDLFGELAGDQRSTAAYTRALASLHVHGPEQRSNRWTARGRSRTHLFGVRCGAE
jgi:mannitol 2-dehydrogenase